MLTIDEIRGAINADPEADWKAADTPIFQRRVLGSSTGLFGLKIDTTVRFRTADSGILQEVGPEPPSNTDWRVGPNACVTPVKDQDQCGACVAFATCAVLESDSLKRTGKRIILSEGHLFHCNGGSCDDGWGLTSGLEAARGGVGLNENFPWTPEEECFEIPAVLSVQNYRSHSGERGRRWAVAAGPVLAGMRVYEDFLAYEGGIYRHVTGDEVGTHAVCVVGYDDTQRCWIVKNSWGAGFGENGYFRIAYGQCGLDSEFQFFSAVAAIVAEARRE